MLYDKKEIQSIVDYLDCGIKKIEKQLDEGDGRLIEALKTLDQIKFDFGILKQRLKMEDKK